MKSLQNFKFDFLKNEFSTGFTIEIPFPKPYTFVYIYLFIYLFIIYLNLGPVLQIVQRSLKIFAHVYIYQLTKFESWFKRYIQKCTLSHVLILTMTSQSW